MNLKASIYSLFSSLLFFSCQQGGGEQPCIYTKLDLNDWGMPFLISAPDSSEVRRIGELVPTVHIRKDSSYEVSIELHEVDKSKTLEQVRADFLAELKQQQHFQRLLHEDAQGFVFESLFDGQKAYNFRYIRLHEGKAYVAQSSLVRNFSLQEIQSFYEAVSCKRED